MAVQTFRRYHRQLDDVWYEGRSVFTTGTPPPAKDMLAALARRFGDVPEDWTAVDDKAADPLPVGAVTLPGPNPRGVPPSPRRQLQDRLELRWKMTEDPSERDLLAYLLGKF